MEDAEFVYTVKQYMIKMITDVWKKKWFSILLILFTILRVLLVSNFPIFARDMSGGDEYLMLVQAENMISGNWLGEYNYLNLSKGFIFPLFLAICNFIGVSYNFGLTFLYIIGCGYFLYAIAKMTKSKLFLLIIYVFLLFNPASFNEQYFQLIYRNALTISQVLILFGASFSFYLDIYSKNRVNIIHLFVIMLDIFSMMNNREDSIWVLPFIFVLSTICFITVYRNWKNSKKAILAGLCLLPILAFPVSTLIASTINYYQYGVFLNNDLSSGNFSKVYLDLLSIDIEGEKLPAYSSLSKKQVMTAMDNSPNLNRLRPYIEDAYEDSALLWAGRVPEDKEFEELLLQWVLRGAATSNGYYVDALSTEKYWSMVNKELSEAFESGKLSKKSIIPSTSFPVWHPNERYMSRWIFSFIDIYREIAAFSDNYVTLNMEPSSESIDDEIARRYEAVTKNFVIRPTLQKSEIAGWIFHENQNIKVGVACEDGKDIGFLDFTKSSDITLNFAEFGENTENCRFVFESKQAIHFLHVYDEEGLLLQQINLKDVYSNYDKSKKLNYGFDLIELEQTINDNYLLIATKSMQTAEPIIKAYQNFGLPLNLLAIIFSIINFTIFIFTKDKQLRKELWLSLLLELSVVLSIIVYLLPMSYVEFAHFSVNTYISPLFPLQSMFCICVILSSGRYLNYFRGNRKKYEYLIDKLCSDK